MLQVSIGSAADGILHVGDKIVQIEHHDATKLAHFDAQNIIKRSGTSLKLGISRPGYPASGAATFSSLPALKTAPPPQPPRHAMDHHFNPGYGSPPSQGGFYQPQPQIHQIPNSYMAPQGKTIEVGGVKKQVVTKQFNSPLNLYSDAAIVEAAVANPASGISAGGHPGFVPTQRHLPSPKDKIISRPQQSETFKLILESEMDSARDQQGVVGREFHQPAHSSRPSSSLSNRSQPNSIMLDNTIHQSASFKRLMHNMAVGPESTDDQTDF